MGRPPTYIPIPIPELEGYSVNPQTGQVNDKHRNQVRPKQFGGHPIVLIRGHCHYVDELVYVAVHGDSPRWVKDEATGEVYEMMIVHVNRDPGNCHIDNLAYVPADPDYNFRFYQNLMKQPPANIRGKKNARTPKEKMQAAQKGMVA